MRFYSFLMCAAFLIFAFAYGVCGGGVQGGRGVGADLVSLWEKDLLAKDSSRFLSLSLSFSLSLFFPPPSSLLLSLSNNSRLKMDLGMYYIVALQL